MSDYKISIVIPVYNAEQYIERCVISIFKQKYTNWELIMVNDGSTDATHTICQKLETQDKRIKYIKKENEGPSIARNVGIDEACGQIVVFVDADDWIEDTMLQTIVESWRDDIDLLLFDFFEVRDSKKSIYHFFEEDNIKFNDSNEKYTRKYLILNILQYFREIEKKSIREIGVPWAKAFNLVKIKENALYFPENMSLYEDCIFLMNFVQRVSNIRYINLPLYNYYVNSTSICNTMYKDKDKFLHNYIKREEAVSEFVQKYYKNDSQMEEAFWGICYNMMKDTLWWIAEELDKTMREKGYIYCERIARQLADNKKSTIQQKLFINACLKKKFFVVTIPYRILHLIKKSDYR